MPWMKVCMKMDCSVLRKTFLYFSGDGPNLQLILLLLPPSELLPSLLLQTRHEGLQQIDKGGEEGVR